MKLILGLILAVTLQGCGLWKTTPPPVIPPDKVVNIAKEALEPCILLNEGLVINTFEDAIVAYGDLSTSYGICANKQSVSIKILKQFGNIK